MLHISCLRNQGKKFRGPLSIERFNVRNWTPLTHYLPAITESFSVKVILIRYVLTDVELFRLCKH
jgi:hypothetical protein